MMTYSPFGRNELVEEDDRLIQYPSNYRHSNSRSPNHGPAAFQWQIGVLSLGFLATTVISTLLLISDLRGWTFPRPTYDIVTQNRATTQLIVTLLSNAFALVYTTILIVLINRAARIYWNAHGATLDRLRFWNALCTRTMFWELPVVEIVLLILFIVATAIPSAVWTGAITPVLTTSRDSNRLNITSYRNTSALHGYPGELRSEGPTIRNAKGLFTYAVGMQFQSSLLAGASAATSVDGSAWQHSKLDFSRMEYIGRSYGVGAAVGLTDDLLSLDKRHIGYSYNESGLAANTRCIHNLSTQYAIKETINTFLYEARGTFPNSKSGAFETATYFGHNGDAIVAIGAPSEPADDRRQITIAAGASYQHLNATQCTMEFIPTLFQVDVNFPGRNISVKPLNKMPVVPGMANLSALAVHQLTEMSADQTNLYSSVVGNAFNASISDFMTAHGGTLNASTLPGIENALVSMIDDILVALSSAQLMIQGGPESVPIATVISAVRPGDTKYIYAIFAINTALLILLLIEATRTRGWKGLATLNFSDPAMMVLATLRRSASETGRCSDDHLAGTCTESLRTYLRHGSLLSLTQSQDIEMEKM